MTQPEALRLADQLAAEIERTVQVDMLHHNAAAELRRLHAENEALREANEAFAQRQEWWNERMVALEAQRDALLEALQEIGKYTGEGSMYTTPWQDIVCGLGEKARAAIAKAEGEKE